MNLLLNHRGFQNDTFFLSIPKSTKSSTHDPSEFFIWVVTQPFPKRFQGWKEANRDTMLHQQKASQKLRHVPQELTFSKFFDDRLSLILAADAFCAKQLLRQIFRCLLGQKRFTKYVAFKFYWFLTVHGFKRIKWLLLRPGKVTTKQNCPGPTSMTR